MRKGKNYFYNKKVSLSLSFTQSPRPRPLESWYFLIWNLFFSNLKISTSTRIHIQIEFARPHESDTYPGIRVHSSSQDFSGNIGDRACVVERAKFASFSAFHGKELGSILFHHRKKKYPDLASTRFRIHGVFNISTQESGFKKLRIRIRDSPDTCKRKPCPERKKCGFQNTRIRVDGT